MVGHAQEMEGLSRQVGHAAMPYRQPMHCLHGLEGWCPFVVVHAAPRSPSQTQVAWGLHASWHARLHDRCPMYSSLWPAPLCTGSGARPGVNNRPPQPLAGRGIRYFAA